MRCNRNELAKVLGYDVKTIDGMVKKGMPYLARPGQGASRNWVFDTVKVLNWLAGSDLDDRMKQAELRLAVAKAGLREIQHATAAGVAINVYEVGDRIDAGDTIVKSRLLAIPGRMAQIIATESDPVVVERLLDAEFKDALRQLDLDWTERG